MDKFDDYFVSNCFYKNSCQFDFKEIGYKLGESDSSGNIVDANGIGLFGLISDECKLRMSYEEYLHITSPIYIGIVGCKYDDVQTPWGGKRIHKE